VIDTVGAAMGNKGIYAIDRGGDREKLYEKFLEKEKKSDSSSGSPSSGISSIKV
jgi:hypothetical protein